MADAPVLGAGSSECGFKSHLPHQKSNFCLPKVTFFIQAADLAYHHALACTLLRLDDIPQLVADDMQFLWN